MLSNDYTILVYNVPYWKPLSVMEYADKGFLGSLGVANTTKQPFIKKKIRGLEDVMLLILFRLLKYW